MTTLIRKDEVLQEIKALTATYCWRCERNFFLSHGDDNGLWWHKDKNGYHECDASGFHELRTKIEIMWCSIEKNQDVGLTPFEISV